MARARYQEIAQHTVRLTAEMPGNDLLNCRMILSLQGTNTGWDQDYFPDAVCRSMSAEAGYRMTVSAKNIADQ